MKPDPFICPEVVGGHHYHTPNTDLYCGSNYLAVCCHCGRVQLIRYRGLTETTDLQSPVKGLDCGQFVRD